MRLVYSITAVLLFKLYALVLGEFSTLAQEALTVGDRIAGLEFSGIRYPDGSMSFEIGRHSKLTILDFWGVNCGPCIASFPKLDSIQKEFGDELEIILVSSATQHWLDSIYQLRVRNVEAFRYLPNFPSVTNDTVLHTLFKHRLQPHYIWIDESGRIRAITGNEEVTRTNIRNMIDSAGFSLPLKSEFLSLNAERALLPQVNRNKPSALRYYSTMMSQLPNVVGSQYRLVEDTMANTVRITRSGSMLYLYADAIFGFGKGAEPFKSANFDYGKRVIVELKNSSRYDLVAASANRPQRFHYEAVLPKMAEKDVYDFYLSDLKKFFRFDGRKEKRKLRCFSLVRISDNDKVRFQGNPREIKTARSFVNEHGEYRVVAASIEMFRKALSTANQSKAQVFLDETGYDGLVDLSIGSPLSDIEAVRKELREKYDMDILEVERDVETLVLTEL